MQQCWSHTVLLHFPETCLPAAALPRQAAQAPGSRVIRMQKSTQIPGAEGRQNGSASKIAFVAVKKLEFFESGAQGLEKRRN